MTHLNEKSSRCDQFCSTLLNWSAVFLIFEFKHIVIQLLTHNVSHFDYY